MRVKAVLLLSGGLDSILAAKLLQRENIEIYPLFCSSIFWKSESAIRVSKELNLSLKIIDVNEKIWELVKNPKYGRGKGVNPCIDCKIMMLKEAKRYMEEIEAHFVVTGEVLGERPMSQRKEVMSIIARDSGLGDLLVRPLSAKLLLPTLPEREGWLKRENLLDIMGRSRKRQLELAKEWGINFFPSPGGGCILTDPTFSKRVKDLLNYDPDAKIFDAEILKYGRHFRLSDCVKLIVGRNLEENEILLKLALPGDFILKAEYYPGPIGILRGKQIPSHVLDLACGIVLRYSDAPWGSIDSVVVKDGQQEISMMASKFSPEDIKKYMI
ncbi:MAG: tRNA 4-thiouridine(8) synthase ThiI [Synergistetes bacterium]|nr:tRNA 4-thiouridine(8) synthase ThiI [Synergistota bacterium]MCX8128118.1 tRNA 4-thiouridine(8) synthase ThiI [Synergistota bacterium]MDW8192494.1 tRNA 4-thiouridine(8) synthase ThiI [Synergistota bacterium]